MNDVDIIKINAELNSIQKDINSLFEDIEEIKDEQKLVNKEIKDDIKSVVTSINELKEQSIFAKGFIKSVLITGAIIGFAITAILKFIKV